MAAGGDRSDGPDVDRPGVDIARRGLIALGAGTLAATLPAARRALAQSAVKDLAQGWFDDLGRMERVARGRGWRVTPLRLGRPASPAEVAALERAAGLKIPPQLRAALTDIAGDVTFGWSIPGHLRPMELQNLPTASALRDHVWSLARMADQAIPNFANWKRMLANRSRSEAPNTPALWDNQFPFADLVNGDMLTIDMSRPGDVQPVRYFSHELEGIHGLAIAPDFFTFVTVLAKLGWAGTEQDSWFGFLEPQAGDRRHLNAALPRAKAWLGWLARDPAAVGPDEPPPAIVAETPAEYALLAAARGNALAGVTAALRAGARPDVVPSSQWLLDNQAWPDEFATAACHAAMHDNAAMLAALAQGGANLNTRRLATGEAVQQAGLDTLRWLIGQGARVNGWKDQRHWPLHLLVTRRGRTSIDADIYAAMLEALLTAGADPDAPWDNGITMLMAGGLTTARILIAHGARLDRRDHNGRTVMHWAREPDKARLLVAHGADINALSSPRPDDAQERSTTPLQALLVGDYNRPAGAVETFLELGADPKIRDGDGRSTLAYCTSIETFETIRHLGLDPGERLPDGGTLIHNLARTSARPMADRFQLLDHLIGLGLQLNAPDRDGRTFLHLVAAQELTRPEDVTALIARGADIEARDSRGRRPHDLVPSDHQAVRDLLR